MTSTIFANFVKKCQRTQFRNVLCIIACPPYLYQNEAFIVFGRCAAEVGSWLPTFCDSLSFPLRVKQSCPETSVTNHRSTPFNIPQDRRPPIDIWRMPEISLCTVITTHPLLVPRSWKSRAIPVHPLGHTGPVTGSLCLYLTVITSFNMLIFKHLRFRILTKVSAIISSMFTEQPLNYDVLIYHNFKPPHALYYLAKNYSF